MSKHNLEQAMALVQGQITRRLQSSIAKLRGAADLLRDLVAAGERVTKGFDEVKEMSPEFCAGVDQVMTVLEPFRSGVALDDQAKAAETPELAVALFGERFVPTVKSENDAEALATLRVLREVITKALNWEASAGGMPKVTKDPFQTTPTTETGSIAAVAASNAGDKAVLSKTDEPVHWPQDMAKQSFHASTNPAFAAAAEAVQKSGEKPLEDWPFDMAPRRARR